MVDDLQGKKKQVEIMQLELNVKRNEVRLLELDEEKIRIRENIETQQEQLKQLKKEGDE